ncbi:unnamed protein product, partial [Brachionus calyciflorus]
MFNELVLFLFQACAIIFAISLTTIVFKVTVDLFNWQCGYGTHDKPDSVSNLKSPVASNVKWTQETPERLFAEQNDIKTNDLRNCLASFMDDECLKRFEFRVSKGPTNLFELEKHMVKLFGWQPEFPTDAVAEFINRRQLPDEDYRDFYTNHWHLAKFAFSFRSEFDQISYDFLVREKFGSGLNEPFVFWQVDLANPQTCAEAFDLVEQCYARLDLFKRN